MTIGGKFCIQQFLFINNKRKLTAVIQNSYLICFSTKSINFPKKKLTRSIIRLMIESMTLWKRDNINKIELSRADILRYFRILSNVSFVDDIIETRKIRCEI